MAEISRNYPDQAPGRSPTALPWPLRPSPRTISTGRAQVALLPRPVTLPPMRRYGSMTVAQAAALAVYLAAFAAASFFHASDVVRWGLLPYDHAPRWINVFWTSLTLLDPLVIALLVTGRRRLGLALAALVMAADVAVNSYAFFVLDFSASPASLLMQSAFLGFVLGSLPFLWPERGPARAAQRGKGKR